MNKKSYLYFILLLTAINPGYGAEKAKTNLSVLKSEPDTQKSFLDAETILKTWEDNYTHFNSIKVAYTQRVLEAIAPSSEPNMYDDLVRLMHVERTEQGTRFHVRYSCSGDGFARPDSIIGGSFDSKITREYFGVEKSGMIITGMIGRNTENMNILKTYMLLRRNLLTKRNPSGPFEIYWIEDPNSKPELSRILNFAISNSLTSVLPNLEIVAGQLCHVIEIKYKSGANSKIWFAHNNGMLVLKYQRHEKDQTIYNEIKIDKIGSVETKKGTVWFPKKAYRTYNDPDGDKLKYELITHAFVPNVEVNESTFRYEFPIGTRVSDRIRNFSYKVQSKEPIPLVGKPMPELQGLGLEVKIEEIKNRKLLLCFGDIQQRPSRNCLQQLNTRKKEFQAQDVYVSALQISKLDKNTLNDWMKKNQIFFPVTTIKGIEEEIKFNWGIQSVPWLILTDAEKTVRAEGFSIGELAIKLKEINDAEK